MSAKYHKKIGRCDSLRKNIREMKNAFGVSADSSSSPRKDYDAHLDAVVRKAYVQGFKKAHKLLHANTTAGEPITTKLAHSAKTPSTSGRQTFSVRSKIKEQ